MVTVGEFLLARDGPVTHEFILTDLDPRGGTSDIVELYRGVRLPVRGRRLSLCPTIFTDGFGDGGWSEWSPVPVIVADAVDALASQGKPEAAEHWERVLKVVDVVVFSESEGILSPLA